jgi:hypothetical protein
VFLLLKREGKNNVLRGLEPKSIEKANQGDVVPLDHCSHPFDPQARQMG